jgi:hypothetical protein
MKSLLMVYQVIRRKYQQQRIPVPLNGMQRCRSNGRGSVAAFRLKDNGKKNVVCPQFSMSRVNKIDDLDTLVEIIKTIKTANDISEILALLK